MDSRTQAELYRRGLAARWITTDEAVAWADTVIAGQASPPIEIIELSLAVGRRPEEAAAELAPLTSGIPEGDLLPETVAWMRAALERDDQRAESIASDLYGMALQGLWPAAANLPELYAVAHEFDPDDAEWAADRDDAVAYLRETLARLANALAPAG